MPRRTPRRLDAIEREGAPARWQKKHRRPPEENVGGTTRPADSPARIGAGASFHGGGLVTDRPDSPHTLVPKMKARFYIGIASNDDMRQPEAKDKLREAFAAAKVPAEIEVYPAALHGWCVPDMPPQAGKPIYNRPDAERAWGKLVTLYKTALA